MRRILAILAITFIAVALFYMARQVHYRNIVQRETALDSGVAVAPTAESSALDALTLTREAEAAYPSRPINLDNVTFTEGEREACAAARNDVAQAQKKLYVTATNPPAEYAEVNAMQEHMDQAETQAGVLCKQAPAQPSNSLADVAEAVRADDESGLAAVRSRECASLQTMRYHLARRLERTSTEILSEDEYAAVPAQIAEVDERIAQTCN